MEEFQFVKKNVQITNLEEIIQYEHSSGSFASLPYLNHTRFSILYIHFAKKYNKQKTYLKAKCSPFTPAVLS
jgi:hypothetical protein